MKFGILEREHEATSERLIWERSRLAEESSCAHSLSLVSYLKHMISFGSGRTAICCPTHLVAGRINLSCNERLIGRAWWPLEHQNHLFGAAPKPSWLPLRTAAFTKSVSCCSEWRPADLKMRFELGLYLLAAIIIIAF